MLEVMPDWREAYPGACVGVMAVSGVRNPQRDSALERQKADLEDDLRKMYSGYDRAALKEIPALKVYNDYYKRFRKTYHVLLQLESVIFKGATIPSVSALVETMFMAELEHLLLTAGHDLDQVVLPVRVGVARGDERYVRLNGEELTLKEGDMYIADRDKVLSSIIYGPDRSTRITTDTKRVLFTVYAPHGISSDQVREHLEEIGANVLQFSPEARLEALELVT